MNNRIMRLVRTSQHLKLLKLLDRKVRNIRKQTCSTPLHTNKQTKKIPRRGIYIKLLKKETKTRRSRAGLPSQPKGPPGAPDPIRCLAPSSCPDCFYGKSYENTDVYKYKLVGESTCRELTFSFPRLNVQGK